MNSDYLGEIRMFAGDLEPRGWKFCHGQILDIDNYRDLFEILNKTYGGDGITNFALPDLRGRMPIGSGSTRLQVGSGFTHILADKIFTYEQGEQGGNNSITLTKEQLPGHYHETKISFGQGESDESNPSKGYLAHLKYHEVLYREGHATEGQFLSGVACSETGSKDPEPINITGPSLGINYIIAITSGPPEIDIYNMAIGEIRLYSGERAPEGWMFCEGQTLQKSKNTALFSILGTYYGGDRVSFRLPNFTGVTCIGVGYGRGLDQIRMGTGRRVTPDRLLNQQNLPEHTHELSIQVSTENAKESSPTGYLAFGDFYTNESGSGLPVGYPFEIDEKAPTEICLMQPYLGLKYMMCIRGIFPSRY